MQTVKRALLSFCLFPALLLVCSPVRAQVTGLSFRPIDAGYSLALDRIVFVSASPNVLHIYNPSTQADQTVGLTGAPQNVSISPDGTHAAVGFANAVQYVDLQAGAVVNTFLNIAVATGRVICGQGYIYVAPGYNGSFISINIGTGQSTTADPYTYASGGTLDSADNAIYYTENGISPNSLNRIDVSTGLIATSAPQSFPYFDTFNVCGPLWLSRDGSTIYSACGTIYRASSDSSKDMRYVGKIPQTSVSQSLAVSDALTEIAAIPTVPSYAEPATPNADAVVNLYSSTSYSQIGQFATTPFQVNSTSFVAHGRWVFFNSSSSALYIITQADSSAGLQLDYAVENVNLTQVNSCNATFATASGNVAAYGSYATVQVQSGEDCVFSAVSNDPWIVLTSGYYGSGNTALTYLVRPNLTAATRTGTITLESQTFTVTEDAATSATSLTPLSIDPVAADYDHTSDKIVMVSAAPNELHVYDPVSQADQIVPLSRVPLSVSVRPDGLAAAVGYSGQVSIVDLQGLTVSQNIAADIDAAGILSAGNGYVYAFPSGYSGGSIYSIQVSTGAISALNDNYYGNIPRLDASGNFIYVGSIGSGSSKLDISSGPATVVNQYPQFPQPLSGDIWLSQNGNRLINSGGAVFFTSTNAAQDLQPDGTLLVGGSIDWAADSQAQGQIATLVDPSEQAAGSQLELFASNGLQLQSQIAMPGFTNAGTSYISHGKYLFWNNNSTQLFAITQADSTSGLLSSFALNLISAPESLAPCSYSASPSTLNLPAASSNWIINITSNCTWTAMSTSSWVNLYQSQANVGNGSISVSFATNSGSARSGIISVGTQTISLSQSAANCTYSLSSTSTSLPVTGGTGSVNLVTGENCPWSAQSTATWLSISGNTSGVGPATIQFSAVTAPSTNSYGNQSGSLTIAGQIFTVTELPTTAFSLTLLPSSVDFGNTGLLLPSGTRTITISNPTFRAIPLGTITLTGTYSGAFSFSTNCGSSLASGSSCSVSVRFTPTLIGFAIAELDVPIDASGTITPVTLTGTGVLSGLYEIVSMPSGKVLEVPNGSTADGTLIAQNSLNGSAQQQWRLTASDSGYYSITNVLTGKVLDVIGESTENGALVQQWDYLKGANQQWQLQAVDDVHYAIINRNSGFALDVPGGSTASGSPIQQWSYLGDPQQRWVLVPVNSYHINNTLSSLALDVAAGSTSSGALLQQSTPTGTLEQQWQFIPVGGGYYSITNTQSGKVLDVVAASTSDGALLQQWDYLGGANQQWQITSLDGTNYEIVNRNSRLSLDNIGSSTTAGTNIQQWTYLGNTNQQWQISPVTYFNIINVNSNKVLDVPGASTTSGTQIQQWVSDGFRQQQWQLVAGPSGNYTITNRLTNQVLDVAGSSSSLGAAVVESTSASSTSQQWQLVSVGANGYEIKNVNSGKVLDVTGLSTANGALLQQWDYLAGTNQQWYFELAPFDQ